MKYFICLLLLPTLLWAGTKSDVKGSGSQFNFIVEESAPIKLSIYVAESSFNKLGVEYYFVAGDILKKEVWQRFNLGMNGETMSLEEGYVLSAEMNKPEIMSGEFMKNNSNGVEMEDFIFSKQEQLQKYFIGLEAVEVPAGKILCSHYQKKKGEQVVDFWISDKAGALGLVKLISKGSKDKEKNYKIELMSLLKNVKPKIDPAKAVPLTEKGKMFLGAKK